MAVLFARLSLCILSASHTACLLCGLTPPLQVPYSLGSDWVVVPAGSSTYSAVDDSAGSRRNPLATLTVTPPGAPLGFTNVLIGDGESTGKMKAQMVPLRDAPEGGTCHP